MCPGTIAQCMHADHMPCFAPARQLHPLACKGQLCLICVSVLHPVWSQCAAFFVPDVPVKLFTLMLNAIKDVILLYDSGRDPAGKGESLLEVLVGGDQMLS